MEELELNSICYRKGRVVETMKDSLDKKYSLENDAQAIIGTEIRLNRKKLSLTLKAVADETCSVSYVSKVETHQIIANEKYLREICSKVKINKEQLEELKKSHITCLRVIDAMFDEDYETIEEIYKKIKGLRNFRHLIIDLYYFLIKKDYKTFDVINNQISSIASTLSDLDLIMYVFIVGKYCYIHGNTADALAIFNELLKYSIRYDKLLTLVYYEYLKCLYRMNSNYFHVIKEKIISLANKELNTKYIKYAYDLTKSFNTRDDIMVNMSDIYIDMTDKTSEIYKLLLNESKDNKVINYLFLYFTDREKFKKEIKDVRFDYLLSEYLFDYLRLKETNEKEAAIYLLNVCLPKSYNNADMIYIIFFKQEIQRYYSNLNKYKRFQELELQYIRYVKSLRAGH